MNEGKRNIINQIEEEGITIDGIYHEASYIEDKDLFILHPEDSEEATRFSPFNDALELFSNQFEEN